MIALGAMLFFGVLCCFNGLGTRRNARIALRTLITPLLVPFLVPLVIIVALYIVLFPIGEIIVLWQTRGPLLAIPAALALIGAWIIVIRLLRKRRHP